MTDRQTGLKNNRLWDLLRNIKFYVNPRNSKNDKEDRRNTNKTIRKTKKQYGNRIQIGKNFKCRDNVKFKFNNTGVEDRKIIIGDGVFFNDDCSITCFERIEIGNNSIFGEGVRIFDHNHRFNKKGVNINAQGYTHAPIKIGNNCWFGSNVVILKGVEVGDNCVVGAGVVLKESVESGSIVTNNVDVNIQKIRLK